MTTIAQQTEVHEVKPATHRVNFGLHHYVAKVTQGLGTIFFRILFYSLFDIEIRGKENIAKEKGPAIIVSNHTVFYDSFIFHLFFSPLAPLLPLRFLGVTKFLHPGLNVLARIGAIDFVYLLFGVSVVTQGMGLEKNLKNPIKILQRGGTVTIFPAGSMRPDNTLGEFKRGAAALALMTGVPIIPVALKRYKEKGKRTRFVISVGSKFNLSPELEYEAGTKVIFEKLSTLHQGI
jgi:1-acyl-sn-glycerol-3-phosphate acyltransferase